MAILEGPRYICHSGALINRDDAQAGLFGPGQLLNQNMASSGMFDEIGCHLCGRDRHRTTAVFAHFQLLGQRHRFPTYLARLACLVNFN
jgi:hypothetical protein